MHPSSSNFNSSKVVTVVSGLPRSGTSMMMRMLQAGGMPILVDHLRAADEDNPHGYFEFEDVKALQEGKIDWLEDAQGKVVKIIAALIPFLPENYSFRIVFMQRALPEVLASQSRMLVNRGKDPDQYDQAMMMKIYEKHLRQVDLWMKTHSNVEYLEVSYNDLLSNPQPSIEKINAFLGGRLDSKRMEDAIDPKLYRQKKQEP